MYTDTERNRYLGLVKGYNDFFFFIPLGIHQMEYQIAAPTAVKLHLKVQPKYINCALAKNEREKRKKNKKKKERKKTQEYMKCKGTSSA